MRNSGYSLVSTLVLGSVMMGTTSIAIMQASKAKTNVISIEEQKKSEALAEAKIAQFFSKFVKSAGENKPEDCYSGEYNYQYNEVDNSGILIVDGETDRSITRLRVTFPVIKKKKPLENNIPALMANQFAIQQSDIVATNILCTDPERCPISDAAKCNPTFSDYRLALGATSNSNITGKITINGGIIPEIPDIPEGSYANSLGDLSNRRLTLPRATDIKGADNTYYYTVGNINRSSIIVNGSSKIRIYVYGSITQAGNNDIKPAVSTFPGQIHLYGEGIGKNWLFSGNSCTEAFIHAPKVNIGINGGGNGCPGSGANIHGVIWAESYNTIGNPSNTALFVEQPGLLSSLGVNYSGGINVDSIEIGDIQTYTRLPI